MIDKGLGRRFVPDERDNKFLLRRSKEASGIEYRYWITRGEAFDQGQTSQCVAYAWNRWLTTNPVVNKPLPFGELYQECQRNDEWPGEEPSYDGSSVRAGAKVLKARGLINAFYWTFDLETMLSHVLNVGPMVVGTNWTRSMFFPDKNGFVRPEGGVIGGHAWTVIGASRSRQAVRAINSWGKEWNPEHKGRFWVSFDDMDKLIKANGEACSALEQRV